MNKIGIDSLVTLSVDAIKVGQDIKKQLADGFQPLSDIPAIVFNDFGKLQEIYDKARPAIAEIKDLVPAELEELESRVAAATGIPATGVSGKIRQSLRVGAHAYRLVLDAKELIDEIKDLTKRDATA